MGWSPRDWVAQWESRGGLHLATHAWPFAVDPRWVWGVGFPLLAALEKAARSNQRLLFGLNGLPVVASQALLTGSKRPVPSLNSGVCGVDR